MFASVMTAYGHDLEYTSVADPVLISPQDVIVKITAAGVCGSDVHIRSGSLEQALGRPEFPYILGHENVGTVVEIGSEVTTVSVGNQVALHPLITCGTCPHCRAGRDMYCTNPQFPGVDQVTSGGFAEYIRTSSRSCIPLPAGLSPIDVVAATDAGLTAYHAVKRALPHLHPGMSAVIVGLGGVGQFALQALRAMSAVTIIAADISADRVNDARELGADSTVRVPTDDALEAWGDTAGEIDIVFDCVGTDSSLASGVSLLRRGGVLSVLGAGGTLQMSSVALTGLELTVLGNYVGHYEDLLELVALMESGRVTSRHVTYSLADAESAMQELSSGKLSGRAVLVP